jgi:hypothetical protein
MSPAKDPKPSEVFSMNSVQSVPSLVKDSNGDCIRISKDDVDDTEHFITHSDHLAKVEQNEVELMEKKFNLTGMQNTRLMLQDRLVEHGNFSMEEHPNTERHADRASIDSLYSAEE